MTSESKNGQRSRWPLMRIDEITEPDAPVVYGILQAGPNLLDGVPYVRPTEMQDDKILIEKVLRTSKEIAQRYSRASLRTDDIILSIVGTIGKVALVPSELDGGNINQSAVRIRPRRDIILPEFLAWVLRSPFASKQYAASMFGSAVMRLNVAHVRALRIPVPSIAIQRRILSMIENRLTRLAAGISLISRVETSLDRYRASIYKTACEGNLVETEFSLATREGRDFVTLERLLEKIPRPSRPNRWKMRSRDIIQGHAALAVGNPKTHLPAGWLWVALADIAKMESGHTPSRSNPSWWNGDIPWLGLVDARAHDGGMINETTQHTNSDGLANSAARLLPAGTVCVSRTAAVGYVVELGKPMATSQDFVNWVPTDAVSSAWLKVVFSAGKEALRRFGKGSIHTTVYFPELLSLHIALPPMLEQKRISSEIERRVTVINRLQSALSGNRARAMRLREAILAAALSGGREESFNVSYDEEVNVDMQDERRNERGLTMPARNRQRQKKVRPILDVLRDHPAGLSVEDLFAETGYFAAGDPDSFYQELSRDRAHIEEVRSEQSRLWPVEVSVRIKLRAGQQ